jgi:small subunit ribosomal protein S6
VNNYELIYIVKPEMSEDDLTAFATKLGDAVKKFDGNFKEVINWGKKKLAYPINRCNDGNYFLAKLEIKPASLRQLEAALKMYDEILRILVVKQEA